MPGQRITGAMKEDEATGRTDGYSKRSLSEKLGIKPGDCVALWNPPTNYQKLLQWQVDGGEIITEVKGKPDLIQAFCHDGNELHAAFETCQAVLPKDKALWISWQKRTANPDSGLDENMIRTAGLARGLVDVKVVAVDEAWSGIKFVYRLGDR